MRTDSIIVALKDEDYRSLVIGIGALAVTERVQLQRKIVEAGITGERMKHCCARPALDTMFDMGIRYLESMNIPPRPMSDSTDSAGFALPISGENGS
jgi:hypothetical protein